MLVLSRLKDESIVINHNITVTVVAVRGDRVRLGIEAPRDVPVHRGEIEKLVMEGLGRGQKEATEGGSEGGLADPAA